MVSTSTMFFSTLMARITHYQGIDTRRQVPSHHTTLKIDSLRTSTFLRCIQHMPIVKAEKTYEIMNQIGDLISGYILTQKYCSTRKRNRVCLGHQEKDSTQLSSSLS